MNQALFAQGHALTKRLQRLFPTFSKYLSQCSENTLISFISQARLSFVPPRRVLASFIVGLFNLYEDLYFTYLEINPLGNHFSLFRFIFTAPSCFYSSTMLLCGIHKDNVITLFSPPVITQDGVYVLDMAAKIDATADYICKAKWGDVEFPPPFGREAYPEVQDDKPEFYFVL